MATSHAAGVIVVGSINADVTTFSQRRPAPGETILGETFTLGLGGKGANQALAAGQAGAATYMVGCVGTDLFTTMVTSELSNGGVDTRHVHPVPGPTGVAHIRVDSSGENDIVMVPLANSELSATQIDTAFDDLCGQASVFLTQLETPPHLTLHAARRAREDGITVILDPAPAARLDPEIWPLVDIVTPNESEAEILSGIPVTDQDSAAAAARWFMDQGAGGVVVTLGSKGCLYATPEGVSAHPAFPVAVKDTTAAGDAFAGYLGAGIASGMAINDAVRYANAAGAVTATRAGASSSIPAREEILELLAKGLPHP